jgi:hypothetical protein
MLLDPARAINHAGEAGGEQVEQLPQRREQEGRRHREADRVADRLGGGGLGQQGAQSFSGSGTLKPLSVIDTSA